jgi:hypothetical protein
MIPEDRNYMIFLLSELHLIDFSKVLETSTSTMSVSLDGTKAFVKWNGSTPDFFSSVLSAEGPYTHAQMMQILSGSEWKNPNQSVIQ